MIHHVSVHVWRASFALLLALAAGACGSGDSHRAAATRTATPSPTTTCPIPDTPPTDDELFGAEVPRADQIAAYGKCPPPGALAAQAGHD